MDVQQYVDKLFAGYESNADMEDFKEELCSNLQERIKYMEKKGMGSKEAFQKATEELGDITEVANQISNEKRKEYIENMYMKTKNYLDVPHIIGYLLAGGLLAVLVQILEENIKKRKISSDPWSYATSPNSRWMNSF